MYGAAEYFKRARHVQIELNKKPIRAWAHDLPQDPKLAKLDEGLYFATHTILRDDQSNDLNLNLFVNIEEPINLQILEI